MDKKKIGSLLSKKRDELGLNNYKLEKKLDKAISCGQMQSVFQGDKSYTLDTLLILLQGLGLEMQFVDAGKKLPVPSKSSDTQKSRFSSLEELRESCPSNLKGLDRTQWINEQRKKSGL